MRILHVTTSVHAGGGQMMLLRLLEQWARAGEQHGVVSLMAGGGLRERMVATGAEVRDVGLREGQLSVAAAIRLARLVRRFRPRLIQGWMYHGNLGATVGRWLGRWRCPVLWSVHHSMPDPSAETAGTRQLLRVSAHWSRSTAAVIFVSQTSACQHEALGYDPSKTIVIPNGFDCDSFRPRPEARAALRQALGVDEATVVVGMVARYQPSLKDHAGLLTAVARLGEAAPLHLVLVGSHVDSSNAALVSAIRAAGLSERVSLLGERHDMPALMAGLDILALASWTEAFPLVLGEAMACGVPCVATNVGDCGLIIGDCGVLVGPGDCEALAAALAELLALGADGRARLGRAARDRILERFTIAAVANRYSELYERLVTTSRTGFSGRHRR